MKRQGGEFALENHMTYIGKLKHTTQEASNSIALLYHNYFLGGRVEIWARNLSLNADGEAETEFWFDIAVLLLCS